MAVPSVEGRSLVTQPMFFSASASEEWMATLVPVRALQYMRSTSAMRLSSTRAESDSRISSPLLDSRRKKASPPSGVVWSKARPKACQVGRSSTVIRDSTTGVVFTNSMAATAEWGARSSASARR